MFKNIKNDIEAIDLLKKVLIQESEDEYYKISPDDFLELMKYSSYNADSLSKIKVFEKKPIWITGNLNLSKTPTKSLGNVRYINGQLDIRDTNISNLDNITITGYVWDSGTPIEKKRLRKILEEKMNAAQERRESDEWNIESNNKEGQKANALFLDLINSGEINPLNDEEKKELIDKRLELKSAQKRYDELEVHDEDLYNEIEVLEQDIEELQEDEIDVYNIIPTKYNYYGLTIFEIIGVYDLIGHEYVVGNEREMDNALYNYADNYISENGSDGFRRSFIENCLDTSSIEEMFREHYYDDVRDNPESYFDESDYETSEEQDNKIAELEEIITKTKTSIKELEKRQEEIYHEIEEPDEYSKQYDEIQSKIDSLERNIEEFEQEIEDIVPDGELTTQMVEDKVDDIVSDKMDNPAESLREWGLDIMEYVDRRELIRNLTNEEGYSMMASYDGTYTTEIVNSTYYYIFRIN